MGTIWNQRLRVVSLSLLSWCERGRIRYDLYHFSTTVCEWLPPCVPWKPVVLNRNRITLLLEVVWALRLIPHVVMVNAFEITTQQAQLMAQAALVRTGTSKCEIYMYCDKKMHVLMLINPWTFNCSTLYMYVRTVILNHVLCCLLLDSVWEESSPVRTSLMILCLALTLAITKLTQLNLCPNWKA